MREKLAKFRRFWGRHVATIALCLALVAGGISVYTLNQQNRAVLKAACNAVTQVKDGVSFLLAPIPVPQPDGSAIQDERIKNIKLSNEARAKADKVLSERLACRLP